MPVRCRVARGQPPPFGRRGISAGPTARRRIAGHRYATISAAGKKTRLNRKLQKEAVAFPRGHSRRPDREIRTQMMKRMIRVRTTKPFFQQLKEPSLPPRRVPARDLEPVTLGGAEPAGNARSRINGRTYRTRRGWTRLNPAARLLLIPKVDRVRILRRKAPRQTRPAKGAFLVVNKRGGLARPLSASRFAVSTRPRPKASIRPQRPGMSSSPDGRCPREGGSTTRWSPIGSRPSIVRRSSSGVPCRPGLRAARGRILDRVLGQAPLVAAERLRESSVEELGCVEDAGGDPRSLLLEAVAPSPRR
jgi:hypothetical protein